MGFGSCFFIRNVIFVIPLVQFYTTVKYLSEEYSCNKRLRQK